ncbi:MAG: FtsX-like permease family protein [Bacteroidota bacterium]|nr:FtsX-like permease family protein [Bacteroidota bacterium]
MNLRNLFFVVNRLCFSKKNRGIVHIISLISLIGIAVGSLALLVVLSVFNGFTSVAETMMEKENPPILIQTIEGEKFQLDSVINKLQKDKSQKDNLTLVPIVEQTAMVSMGTAQSIVKLIGTNDEYFKYNALDTLLINNNSTFKHLDKDICILGVGLAFELGLGQGAEKMGIPLKITIPQTDNQEATVLEDMLQSCIVTFAGCFQSNSQLDEGYIFIHIDKARELLGYKNNEVTALYDIPKPNTNKQKYIQKRKAALKGIENIEAKNLLEQQSLYFRIVKSEKFAVYVILSFILFIATINILSSLIILYIQKQRMNYILRALGTTKRDLQRIYFYYGMTINIVGCILGIVLGLIICFLQQKFGLIKLAGENFVVDAFPVRIMFGDIIRIILIVIIIGTLTIRIVTNRLKIK